MADWDRSKLSSESAALSGLKVACCKEAAGCRDDCDKITPSVIWSVKSCDLWSWLPRMRVCRMGEWSGAKSGKKPLLLVAARFVHEL
jgi:hypothetical protein